MLEESCSQVALLIGGCCAQIAAQVEFLGGRANWPVQSLSDHAAHETGPTAAAFDAETEFFAAMIEAFCQSLLETVSLLEAQGNRSSAVTLSKVLRDINRCMWLIVPQNMVETHRIISLD